MLSPELRAAALGPDLSARQLATELLTRIEVDAALPLLELALVDTDAAVRLHGALGLARHPSLQPAQREALLVGSYAAAPSTSERAMLLGLLADTLARADAPAFEQAFQNAGGANPIAEPITDPIQAQAACGAVARLAQRGHVPGAAVLERIPERLVASEADAAILCATALADRTLAAALSPPVRLAAARALHALAGHSDPSLAVPALAALPVLIARDALPVLEVAAGSVETRIALEAVRQLRSLLSPAGVSKLLGKELDRQLSSPGLLGGPRLHVLLVLFLAAEAHPNDASIAELADRALAALAAGRGGAGIPQRNVDPARAGLGRSLAHCAAARLRDMTRKWPATLGECGQGRVPEALRDAWVADVLARATDSHALRATQLGRLFDKGPRPVRLATLAASSTLPATEALPLLTRALAQDDPLVLAAAARQLSARGADFRGIAAETDLPSALSAAFATAEGAPDSSAAWLGAVVALVGRPSAAHRVLLEAIAGPGAERIAGLARSPIAAVRDPARRLLAEWELPDPGAPLPVQDPLPADRWPAPRSTFHVKLVTTAGSVQISLDSDGAPAAVVRFVALARSGALDNLPIAALVPGRVIELVPLSDTGPALRDELSQNPIQRGSVLLQDHGRDAVGPGFAIILERSPLLDRRATVLGRIISGLEIADVLTAADRVLEAQVEIK